jgi:hypothetical protein
MPDLWDTAAFRPATPDETFDYKPKKDEPTRMLAALLASLKIVSRAPDRLEATFLRHGINRLTTALDRNSK